MLKREDILHQEKLSLVLYMKYRESLSITQSAGEEKNAHASENCRKLGNQLYTHRPHDRSMHEDICNYYSQSIALAPNNSEDLAAGYGNRSALLFHLKKYKECIIDIDRALCITSNKLLKVKLLCRKAESLVTLSRSAKVVCEEALQILKLLKDSQKTVYAEKLNKLLINQNGTMKSNIELPEKNTCININFERSKEIPSASKLVAIKYDKKWGQHLVAVEDINPGEIISIQKCIFDYIKMDKKYLFCSYCRIIAYNSLPCEFCIHSVYCSEACQSKSWNEYHQYECVIYQHCKESNKDILYSKYVFSTIYEVGGIEQMKDLIWEIENTEDLRVKGFSNGIYHTDQKKNLYTLKKCSEDFIAKYSSITNICNYVYLLAKFTNFFGQKTNLLESEILLNEDRLFIAALFLRTVKLLRTNVQSISPLNLYIELFSCLINHSCYSNVRTISTNNSKIIIFASHTIKKGSQLFLNRHKVDIFLDKKERQSILENVQITCECIACREDWSPISLPSIKQLLQITPVLDASVVEANKILLKQIDPKNGLSRFTPKLFNQVCQHLIELDEKFTPLCNEYFILLKFIDDLIYQEFSNNCLEMPEQCE